MLEAHTQVPCAYCGLVSRADRMGMSGVDGAIVHFSCRGNYDDWKKPYKPPAHQRLPLED